MNAQSILVFHGYIIDSFTCQRRVVIGFIGKDKILYEGLPTTGRQIKTVVDSPLVGRKPLPSVKITDLSTGEFQTVIDNIHPYNPVSYGRPKNKP